MTKWFVLLFLIVSCGESGSGASPSDGVPAYDHRIFVSEGAFTGNFGSISNADALCQIEAQSAGLVRTYKAIISDESVEAKERIELYGSVYTFDASGTIIRVVSLSEDLWKAFSQNFLSPVEFSVNGAPMAGTVWTGSDSEGNRRDTCANWSSASLDQHGQSGEIGQVDGLWLEDNAFDDNCSESKRFYCISQ